MSRPVRGGALVTGGSRRVGRALCLELARAGYAVAVHYRGSAEDAEGLVGEIGSFGGRAAAVQADLDDPRAAEGLAAAAAEAVGPLHLLVNNASHFGSDAIASFTEASFHAHMGPNLLAPLLITQRFAAAAQALPTGADPSVVNLLDQRVLRPNPQFFSYTLSKSALFTATLTLAQALAPKIRVNAVGPGPTLASIHQSPEAFQEEVDGVILQRPSSLGDIAAAVLFLAGAASVTGQLIAVDGGQHLGWRTPDIIEV
jgi:NAD(P)-dependent dehydrogenase (short-subunit alcohol dehydrogenase family)